jgi:SecD/SecF fusion protein
VKGFAQTLAIGIVVSLFTALFVTKFILNAFYAIGFDSEKLYGEQKPKEKYFNYVGHAPKFVIASLIVIAIGIVALFVNKANDGEALAYGLDFKGGTSTQITLPDTVTSDVSKDLETLVSSELGVVGEIVSVQESNSYIIKTTELSQEQAEILNRRLIKDYNIDPELITSESISGTVSGEMTSDAIKAVIIAIICMLFYIWVRFKNIGFASSAIIALLHDVLVVLMVYAVVKITVSGTFIACMLTILGYSINATIIIFDRIRENKKEKLKKDSLSDIVNASIGQTLSRSINTSLTTFIMVFALAIFGVESIKEFAIPLMAHLQCAGRSRFD